MTELDQVWAHMLDRAAVRAGELGREDIVAYLRLKATNDAIRAAGVKWLFDTVIEIGTGAQKDHPHMTIERIEPHKFKRASAQMVGSRLEVRNGVRCLSFEAGWTRTPSDGIMRGQALAIARVEHFGLTRHNAELKLVHGEDLPQWLGESGGHIVGADLKRHFDIFLER